MVTKEQIIETLKKVYDPEIQCDIWSLGLVYDIGIEGNKVKIFELKDNVQYAKFYIVLNFSKDNILPSGREWIMELSTTSIGWKITDFHLSDTTP